jgi:hypothetical protein
MDEQRVPDLEELDEQQVPRFLAELFSDLERFSRWLIGQPVTTV